MALEGTLKDFALPDIFQLIGLQKKTGALILKAEADEVTIGFKDGMLVSADSRKRRLEDRLGTMLVRSELITEGQLHDVLEKQKQTLQRVGVILVNDGLIKKDDLSKALELQVTQIIYRVFRWEDAYYKFDQDAQVDYDRDNFQPIGAESILMEGMRMLDEWPLVEKVVRSLHVVYEKVPVNQPIEIEGARRKADDDEFDFDLGAPAKGKEQSDKITLSRDDGTVYQLLDGKRTVEDVMYLARMSEFDTCKALYDLLSRDLIREATGGIGKTAAPAAPGLQAAAAEASPIVVAAGLALVAIVTIAGAVLHRYNPIPVNTTHPAGVIDPDVLRQEHAALGSRLERVVHALEAHRLASGDERYAEHLEELVDLAYVRPADIHTSWGEPFEYTVTDGGAGFRLKALDRQAAESPELTRQGGSSAVP